MNKRPIYIAIIYSCLVIAYKLFIVLQGYLLTKFGFYYSHIVSVFFIIPFIWLAIKLVRDKDYEGVIMGRQAFVAGLTVVAISAIILSVYHYIEFDWRLKDIAVQYYNSPDFLEFLKKNPKIKPEQYPQLITEQLASLSAFKATTARLMSFFFIGVSSSFICAALMKK
jgi:hypothetical protein